MKVLAALALVSLLLTGCVNNKMIVDQRGIDAEKYQQDLADCELYAEEISIAERTATGAAAGAVIGGVMGALLGNSSSAEKIGGVGAVSGGTRGAGSAAQEKRMIIRNCLKGRGYRV